MNQKLRPLIEGLKKNSQVVCGMGLGIMFSISYAPEGCFSHHLGKFYQLYESGLPVDLDKHTEFLKDEVLDLARLKPEAEVDVRFIPTSSADPIHKGSTKLRGGSLIGFPANFRYRKLEDVERHRLLTGGKAPDWSKEATNKLANSLVLSDDAKKFVIAREIGYVDTWQAFNRPLLASLVFITSYTMGFMANETFNLRRRLRLGHRMILYTIFGTLGAGLYVLMMDSYLCHLDRRSDKRAAQLGLQYVDGGVEYYQKLLERNSALRELLPEGKKHYTLYGNDVSTWRQKTVSLTERLNNLKSELGKYSENKEETVVVEEQCVHCQ